MKNISLIISGILLLGLRSTDGSLARRQKKRKKSGVRLYSQKQREMREDILALQNIADEIQRGKEKGKFKIIGKSKGIVKSFDDLNESQRMEMLEYYQNLSKTDPMIYAFNEYRNMIQGVPFAPRGVVFGGKLWIGEDLIEEIHKAFPKTTPYISPFEPLHSNQFVVESYIDDGPEIALTVIKHKLGSK